jgi:hypothetical protein
MSKKNIIVVAIMDIMCQKIHFFLSMIIIGASLAIIGYFSLFSNISKLNRDECDKILTKGINGTGVMQVFSSSNSNSQKELIQNAYDSGIFEFVGVWEYAINAFPLPNELLQTRRSNMGYAADATPWVYVQKSVFGLHNIKFSQRINNTDENWNNPNRFGIYLGANYNGIPVGTTYVVDRYGESVEFEVLGIIKKGQMMMSSDVCAFGRADELTSLSILDDVIIMVYSGQPPLWVGTYSNGAYVAAGGHTLKEARDYLENRAKELDIDLESGYLSEGFRAEEIEENDLQRVDRELSGLIIVTCVLLCMCIICMEMLGNRRQYGIYYANGFSLKDLLEIQICQNIIRVLLPMIGAWFILSKYLEKLYDIPIFVGTEGSRSAMVASKMIEACSTYESGKLLAFWRNQTALPYMIIVGIALFILCTVIPVLIIGGKEPYELLKDTRG